MDFCDELENDLIENDSENHLKNIFGKSSICS
jgi:hypothetical protein